MLSIAVFPTPQANPQTATSASVVVKHNYNYKNQHILSIINQFKEMKKNILLLFCVLSAVICRSQITYENLVTIFMGSDYIFEGQVIRSDPYLTQNGQMIYTSNTVEISKIFKGDLVCGTIELITEGGEVNGKSLEISHNLTFRVGEIGIFCANNSPYEAPQIDYYPESNSTVVFVKYSEQGFFKYFFDDINPAVTNSRYDFDSLVQVYDTLQLATQVNYIDCSNQPISSFLNNFPKFRLGEQSNPRTSIIENKAIALQTKQNKIILQEKRAKIKKLANLKTLVYPDSLFYTFENESFTTDGSGNHYLEFDIYLASDEDTYFDNGEVFIQYDTTVFGSYIQSAGNITVDRGVILTNATNYATPVPIDSGYNYFLVQMVAYINPPGWYTVTNVPQQAIHIKMKTKRCNQYTSLKFVSQNSMQNNSFWSDGVALHVFDEIVADDTAYSILCKSTITDVYPDEMRGGVGDTLYIKGANLGNDWGSIIMRNADAVGNYVFLNRGVDYTNAMWTDTLIKVVLPAIVDSIGAYPSGSSITIYKEGVVGSGNLAIVNQWGGPTSLNNPTTYVKVVYGVRDRYHVPSSNKKRVIIVDDQYPPTTPYYTFYTDSLTKSNPQAIAIIFQALEDWSCYTQIEYRLDTTSVIIFPTDSVLNFVNTIRFAPKMPKVTVRGETKIQNNLYCISSQTFIAQEIDIYLKDTTIWWYNLTSTSPATLGMWDFYEVVLHELGHAYMCQHVKDTTQLMNTTTNNTVRTIDLSVDSSAVAAINTRDFSLSKLPACGWFAPVGYTCGTNAVEDTWNTTAVIVFPNPFTNEITVHFEVAQSEVFTISVLNVFGQTVYYKSDFSLEKDYNLVLPDLSQGIYFLTVEDKNNLTIFTTKILKQ